MVYHVLNGAGCENKHVTLSPHSAIACAIGGHSRQSLLNMVRGYSDLETDIHMVLMVFYQMKHGNIMHLKLYQVLNY